MVLGDMGVRFGGRGGRDVFWSRRALRGGRAWVIVVGMRFLTTTFLLLGLAVPALAVDKANLDKLIVKLTTKFDQLQGKTDRRVPAENLRKAQGIILLDRTKAGFVFAFEGGGGVAMVKDAKTGAWSPPVFLRASEASLGLQAGGQQSFVVILLMHTNATRALTDSSFKFGGEASGTAGNSSGKAEGTVGSDTQPLMLYYTDAEGLYGGVAVKGGTLSSDAEANIAYYGQYWTAKEILFEKKAKPSERATALAQKITQASK
jgi:SH3 domain-containing YSC84-like protein 1